MTTSPEDIRRAHLILDRARSGAYVSTRVIVLALTITGDLPSLYRSRRIFGNNQRKKT